MANIGILHVQSTSPLMVSTPWRRLRALGDRVAIDFVGMSKHSDTFDPHKVAYLVDECLKVSHH